MPLPTHCAFVTLLMMNDSYLPGVLLQAYELSQQAPLISRVCLITEDVSDETQNSLSWIYDHVVCVDKIFIPHVRRQNRQDRPFLLTRLQALRLGPDGDLGMHFKKIVLLDADILPLKRFDQLFLLETPAGILNEHKSHFITTDTKGRYIKPKNVDITGRWVWHQVYRNIGHGNHIPEEITKRVTSDPYNLGINTALMVLQPSFKEYRSILEDIKLPDRLRLLTEIFDWPDMQYLTLRWSGQWVNIDASFCGFCGYPSLSVLCGTHYAGQKPWNYKNADSFKQYSRFPDFIYWHQQFLTMMQEYRDLYKVKRLSHLTEKIQTLPTMIAS